MFDWRTFTGDPNDPGVAASFRAHILSMRRFEVINRDDYLLRECDDKEVLDIGPCEHTREYMDHKNWFFRRESKRARRVVGVDIDEELCQYAQTKGYEIRFMDACSDSDLGERFELVLACDVIEHVSDLGGLLRFIKRHLKGGTGKALLTTPNPFYYGHFMQVLRTGTSVPNFEHTCWVTPTCMHELARREGLELTGILFPVRPSSGRRLFVRAFPWGRRLLESLSREYFYELRVDDGGRQGPPAET